MAENQGTKVSGVTYTKAGDGYFEKRSLKRSAGVWGLWGLAVAAVISGDFSGWNFTNSRLYRTSFRNGNVTGACFRGANLEWAVFDGAHATGAAGRLILRRGAPAAARRAAGLSPTGS